MLTLKNILKFVATPAGIIILAILIIQFQFSRNNKLKNEVQELKNQIAFQQIVNGALKDTLKNIGKYEPIPETVEVKIVIPGKIDSIYIYEDSVGGYYLRFDDKKHWDKWYREHCTGVIEFDTTKFWDNDKGARVQGKFYYGTGTGQHNWLLISPVGNWSLKTQKEGLRCGIEWLISTSGDISIGGDLTWRKWGPATRVDILEFSKARFWVGLRRNF
ncbi:MAG: hypothetical protein B6D58_05190 [candidate division Zixibacteria bacterium 4484_95]|nr:MAG: hypothetical protein B6D58_05190 [candidate division Zixibacteria bacterium 4484_95]